MQLVILLSTSRKQRTVKLLERRSSINYIFLTFNLLEDQFLTIPFLYKTFPEKQFMNLIRKVNRKSKRKKEILILINDNHTFSRTYHGCPVLCPMLLKETDICKSDLASFANGLPLEFGLTFLWPLLFARHVYLIQANYSLRNRSNQQITQVIGHYVFVKY